MRCTHCGWNNNDSDTHCIKCGNVLGSPVVEMVPCPACTYLMNPKARHCPQCGTAREGAGQVGAAATVAGQTATPVSGQTATSAAGPGHPGSGRSFAETIAGKTAPDGHPIPVPTVKGASPDEHPAPPAADGSRASGSRGAVAAGAGTIDPYRQPSVPSKEVFLQRLDARDEPPVVLAFSTKEDHIEVNRANLDAANNAITSKVQAEFTFSEGKWHIKDRSEKKSTFIQVAETHELKEGDILLIGNKRFIFSTRNPNQ